MTVGIADLIRDAAWLPHRLSVADDLIEFLPTTREALHDAAFIDGRSEFASGPAQIAPLSAIIGQADAAPSSDRFIFHIAFCGSTLLSRLLDRPGAALVLREPNCLVDLAAHRAEHDRVSRASDDRPILDTLCALLRRSWQPGEAVVVKPTNWINTLAPDLCARAGMRPLFLTARRDTFVRAVFRGGSERIAFAARAAVHLSTRGHDNAELVATALARDVDQTGKLAALVAATHEIQLRLLREAAAAGGFGAAHWLEFEDLVADPLAAAGRAAAALGLPLCEAELAEAVARWSGAHAKQPDTRFSAEAQRAADHAAAEQSGPLIDDALAWADQAIGRDDCV